MIKKINKFRNLSTFNLNSIILFSSSFMTQIIALLMMPILARIFTTYEFGFYGVFTAMCAIGGVVATARYEMAINLPKSNMHSLIIFYTAIALSLLFCIILIIFVMIFKNDISIYFGFSEFEYILYFVPASIFLVSVRQSSLYLLSRHDQYLHIAAGNLTQTISTASTQVTLGSITSISGGLTYGQILGQFISVSYLLRKLYEQRILKISKSIGYKSLYIAKRYKKFPNYLLPAQGINVLIGYLPILLIGRFYSIEDIGVYVLVHRALSVPVTMISNSVGIVFRQNASDEYITLRNCSNIYRSTFKKLFLISIIPFFCLAIFPDKIFGFAFGESWMPAASIAKVLVPMYFIQAIVSPLAAVFVFTENQKLDLIWQTIFLISVVTAFWLGAKILAFEQMMLVVSLIYGVMYVLNGVLSYFMAIGKIKSW